MRILLVEDEPNVALFIKKGLKEQTHDIEIAYDGLTALRLFMQKQYDFIILDVIIPQMGGVAVCKEIRKNNSHVPVLILSALDSIDDIVDGLDAGADDYLTKPFKFKELLARIRALSRRKTDHASGTVFSIGNLELNTNTKTIIRGGNLIKLTMREFYLLEFLMKNAGRVLSRSEIAENVWDLSYDQGTNVVDVYINYLRNKIDKPFSQKLIHTIFGMGYVLKEEK